MAPAGPTSTKCSLASVSPSRLMGIPHVVRGRGSLWLWRVKGRGDGSYDWEEWLCAYRFLFGRRKKTLQTSLKLAPHYQIPHSFQGNESNFAVPVRKTNTPAQELKEPRAESTASRGAGQGGPDWACVPHLSKAGSRRRFQRSFSAYFSILSLASTLVTLKPSSTSMMESTLGRARGEGGSQGAWEGEEKEGPVLDASVSSTRVHSSSSSPQALSTDLK